MKERKRSLFYATSMFTKCLSDHSYMYSQKNIRNIKIGYLYDVAVNN